MEQEEAARDSYDRVAGAYAEHFLEELEGKPFDRALLDCLAEQVDRGLPVADVGCGPGHVARYLHERGVRALGIDLSPRMVEAATAATPEIAFHAGSMLALEAADGAWGGAVAFYSVIHFTDDELARAFGELHRALAPGGRLLLAFHVGQEVVHVDELLGTPISLDFRFLDTGAVTKLLEATGFTVEVSAERLPCTPVEAQTRRAYLIARKDPAATTA